MPFVRDSGLGSCKFDSPESPGGDWRRCSSSRETLDVARALVPAAPRLISALPDRASARVPMRQARVPAPRHPTKNQQLSGSSGEPQRSRKRETEIRPSMLTPDRPRKSVRPGDSRAGFCFLCCANCGADQCTASQRVLCGFPSASLRLCGESNFASPSRVPGRQVPHIGGEKLPGPPPRPVFATHREYFLSIR
jgi:hypothetical protein